MKRTMLLTRGLEGYRWHVNRIKFRFGALTYLWGVAARPAHTINDSQRGPRGCRTSNQMLDGLRATCTRTIRGRTHLRRNTEGRLALMKHSMKIVLFYSTFIIALTSSGLSYAASLYQRLSDGSVWGYTGTPCNVGGGGNPCPGWQKLNADSRTVEIEAGGNNLYQRLRDGSVWGYTGTPCNAGGGGNPCPGWQKLNADSRTVEI